MNRPKITVTSDGVGGRVTVDDVDISGVVRSADLILSADDLPIAQLDVYLEHVEIDGEMQVKIPARTHSALVALGWTPPP